MQGCLEGFLNAVIGCSCFYEVLNLIRENPDTQSMLKGEQNKSLDLRRK